MTDMKLAMKLLALFFGVMMLSNLANAVSPREQLRQLVRQLQNSPNDNALREQIIKLAIRITPAPTMPDEAERHIARGTEAFKEAKSTADYQAAVQEFQQATLAAPWSADTYFNLGLAQDKAEDFEASLRSLKLAQLASPGSKDIKDLYYKVEYQRDKAPEQKAAAAMEQNTREIMASQENFPELINKLRGAVFVGNDGFTYYFVKKPFHNPDDLDDAAYDATPYLKWQGSSIDSAGRRGYSIALAVIPKSNSEIAGGGIYHGEFTVSADGKTLTEHWPDSGTTNIYYKRE